MDLGFGNSNQAVGDAATSIILQAQRAQESAIESEISKYDALLNANDETLESLREKRLAQLRQAAQKKDKWRSMGHGTYQPLGEGQHSADCAKEFFECSKASERMVVHFHRRTTRLCDIFHGHLEKLAVKHLETRFVKIDVEAGGAADYLVEKLGIIIMPTIVIVKDRKVVHHLRGFDELGGTEDFSTAALEYMLGYHGGIFQSEGQDIPEELLNGGGGVNSIRVKKGTSRGGSARNGLYNTSTDDWEDDSDFED